MVWLIDGYNVIRRDPELAGIDRRSLEEGREALLRLVARVAHESPDDFVVVFDGIKSRATARPDRRVSVVFSKPPEKADDVLIRLARQRGAGATVVSSDHAVQDGARRARAAAVSADAFLDRTSEDGAEDRDGGDEEPDHTQPRKGNPRRLSRAARQAQRALGRLRMPPPK